MTNEKPLVLIGTPHYSGFTLQYVLSGFASVYELYPQYRIALATAESAQIQVNRNRIIEIAYDNKVDYLLFIDTDMMWLPAHIVKLVESGKEIIGGLCTNRKPNKAFCVYESDGTGLCRSIKQVPEVPFRTFAIGAAFLLLRKRVFRKMWDDRWREGFPFDLIPHGKGSRANVASIYSGEDISFCQRARKQKFDIWCDPSVRPGHVGQRVYGAPEPEEKDGVGIVYKQF